MKGQYSIDTDRWSKLTIFEQMGNIYSEIGRSFAAKNKGDKKSAEFAMIRCLDLFDATVNNLIKNKLIKAKEVLRAKEQYLELFNKEKIDKNELQSLDRYFLHFALAARLHR